MTDFDPTLHPRDVRGRFAPKVSQSVRVSPISVSYNVGLRVPVIPGRANVYVGALFRLERARGGSLFKKQTDAAINRAALLFGANPNGNVATLLKDREITLDNGTKIKAPGQIINTPSFRVTKSSGGRPARLPAQRGSTSAPQRIYAPGGKTYRELPQGAGVRAPRRRPRQALVNGRRVR